MYLEAPGIDPGTSRMLSERSTIWATPPPCVELVTYAGVTEYYELVLKVMLVIWLQVCPWKLVCSVIYLPRHPELTRTNYKEGA